MYRPVISLFIHIETKIKRRTIQRDNAGEVQSMTSEKIKHYCCCCGLLLSDKMTAYELIQCGCGTTLGDGGAIFHCRKHTQEEIVKALAADLKFRRASELRR